MSKSNIITVEQIKSWHTCSEYTDERLKELIGEGKTPLEIAELDIPVTDIFWCLLREKVIPAKELRLLACDFAERVLDLFEKKYPDDKRPRNAIEVARRFAEGKADERELSAACAAAAAAYSASAAAAAYAASAASSSAAASSAAYASSAAAAAYAASAAAAYAASAASSAAAYYYAASSASAASSAAAYYYAAASAAAAASSAAAAERKAQLDLVRKVLEELGNEEKGTNHVK